MDGFCFIFVYFPPGEWTCLAVYAFPVGVCAGLLKLQDMSMPAVYAVYALAGLFT